MPELVGQLKPLHLAAPGHTQPSISSKLRLPLLLPWIGESPLRPAQARTTYLHSPFRSPPAAPTSARAAPDLQETPSGKTDLCISRRGTLHAFGRDPRA